LGRFFLAEFLLTFFGGIIGGQANCEQSDIALFADMFAATHAGCHLTSKLIYDQFGND